MTSLQMIELSGFRKIKGLTGEKKAYPVYFKTHFGIHTFGVKFPIDVLILDDDSRVVRLAKNLQPNRIFIWNPKYNRVIELPSGFIEKKQIILGEKIGLAFFRPN